MKYSEIKSSKLLMYNNTDANNFKKRAMQITCRTKDNQLLLGEGLEEGLTEAQGDFGGNEYIHNLNCSDKFHEYILMSKIAYFKYMKLVECQ